MDGGRTDAHWEEEEAPTHRDKKGVQYRPDDGETDRRGREELERERERKMNEEMAITTISIRMNSTSHLRTGNP